MKKLLIAGASFTALMFAGGAASAATFPGYGLDTGGPALLITLNSDGTTTLTSTGQPQTYDGADDTYIGVINNSGNTVNALNLSSNADIFGFDGDGIDTYGAPGNAKDTTGYGGPDGYFTNITGSYFSLPEKGTVNFIGGIANGGSDYFSLEEALTTASFTNPITVGGVPEPMTWAMMLMGFFGIGAAVRRRRETGVLA